MSDPAVVRSPRVIALIPARSGSKGIPHKNIRAFCGKPLLAHSIEQARACPLIHRVLVSTDSEAYAAIAREHGAEAPFLRPPEISGDLATDLEAFQHALRWLEANEGSAPEICVHLRPTHPNRSPRDLDGAIRCLLNHPEWDSVRSVIPAPETPFKMWFMEGDGLLRPVVTCKLSEAHSRPRQMLPQAYLQNASIDVIRTRTILEKNSIAGDRIGAYVMQDSHDIDTPEQMERAAAAFARAGAGIPRGKTFVFDIDGVIASLTPGNDYRLAQPLADNIARVNLLHQLGNRIVLFTARGFLTGKDWTEVTRRQMQEWGVSHDELRFGKPAADFYVDDKMLGLTDLAAWEPELKNALQH